MITYLFSIGNLIKEEVIPLKTLIDETSAILEQPGLPLFDMQIGPGSFGVGNGCSLETA